MGDPRKREEKLNDYCRIARSALSSAWKTTEVYPRKDRADIQPRGTGKSRDEIAEIIGVTTGTLQVTCSKLGISLRRPSFDLGTGLLPKQQPRRHQNGSSKQSNAQPESEGQCAKGPPLVSEGPKTGEAMARAPKHTAVFTLRMEYKGQHQLICLSMRQ
jgi:hypothetical protein